MELERRSSGTAKAGLATGVVGTSLGALNSMAILGAGAAGIGNGFFGRNNGVQPVIVMENGGWGGCGNGWNGYGRNGDGCCSEDHYVNRYELELQQKIAEKDSQIALRDANTYQDQKMLDMYKYIDGELKDIRGELARQAVVNQKTVDSFEMVKQDLDCCCDKLAVQIARERDERRCNDNIIVTYANATFYAKSIADVTVGTTTTPQSTYNPLPCNNGCDCKNN